MKVAPSFLLLTHVLVMHACVNNKYLSPTLE